MARKLKTGDETCLREWRFVVVMRKHGWDTLEKVAEEEGLL